MPAFKVALSGDFFDAAGKPAYPMFDLSPLRAHEDIELVVLTPCEEIAPEQLAEVDALILLAPGVTARSLSGGARLAVVARFGVGYDSVDVEACTAKDVALVITPEGVRRPVAVSILTLMLALAGKLMVKDRLTRRGAAGWAARADHMGVGLVGLTLGSIGIGNIGAELFRLAKPLDMNYLAHDPYADPALAEGLGIELVGLEALFRRADVLTVNCPLSEATHHLVNAERLALMKSGAYLINTARGPIVDQGALTAALAEGGIAGAGLDVLEREPPDPEDPILRLDNVILTPHALCWTDQCFAGNGAADVRAVLDVKAGRVPRGVVNRAVVDRPGWRAKLRRFAG